MFLFYHENLCYVYSLESSHRGDSNKYMNHAIIIPSHKEVVRGYRVFPVCMFVCSPFVIVVVPTFIDGF